MTPSVLSTSRAIALNCKEKSGFLLSVMYNKRFENYYSDMLPHMVDDGNIQNYQIRSISRLLAAFLKR